MHRLKKWVKDHPGETMIIAGVVLFGVSVRHLRGNVKLDIAKGEAAKEALDAVSHALTSGLDVIDCKDVRLLTLPAGTKWSVLMYE